MTAMTPHTVDTIQVVVGILLILASTALVMLVVSLFSSPSGETRDLSPGPGDRRLEQDSDGHRTSGAAPAAAPEAGGHPTSHN